MAPKALVAILQPAALISEAEQQRSLCLAVLVWRILPYGT